MFVLLKQLLPRHFKTASGEVLIRTYVEITAVALANSNRKSDCRAAIGRSHRQWLQSLASQTDTEGMTYCQQQLSRAAHDLGKGKRLCLELFKETRGDIQETVEDYLSQLELSQLALVEAGRDKSALALLASQAAGMTARLEGKTSFAFQTLLVGAYCLQAMCAAKQECPVSHSTSFCSQATILLLSLAER